MMMSDGTFPNRLSKVDDLTRPDHWYLTEDDHCFFIGEYTARQGFAAPPRDVQAGLGPALRGEGMAFRRTLPVAARARGSLRRKPAAVPLPIPFAASWPCGVIAATSPARPALDRTDAKHQYFLMADVPFDTLAVTRGLE